MQCENVKLMLRVQVNHEFAGSSEKFRCHFFGKDAQVLQVTGVVFSIEVPGASR